VISDQRLGALVLVIVSVWGGRAVAQSADGSSDAELSKDSVNPVARHITVPLRYQAEFQDGPYKATKSTFELDQALCRFA
jgi:hypothetical protein